MTRHLWLVGTAPDAGLPVTTLGSVTGDRRLRGAYTAAGEVLRALVPRLLDGEADLVQRYDIEVLAAAPGLRDRVENRRTTLTSEAAPETRTRYYPHHRMVWIGSGLADLVLGGAAALGGGQVLAVTDLEWLDPTDVQWLAGLVRRADPSVLRLVLTSAHGGVAEPLLAALRQHAVRRDLPGAPPTTADTDDLFTPAEHDAEADRLEATGVGALRRGAVLHHRERGTDPALAARVLTQAQAEALMAGFYDQVVELGSRIRALVPWAVDEQTVWLATVKMTIAHQAMGEPDEAMALFDDACASSTMPSVHMQSAYGRAMVYTRYYDEARRDLRKAKGLVNTAVALAGLSTDDQRRAYNRTFNENGLALIDMHLGEVDEAVRLVEGGIERLEREVDGGRYLLHRSVLRYNHAQLMLRRGDVERALDEYTQIIAEDPHHPDYWFERAAIFQGLGRLDEAVADYSEAIRVGPPYPEPIYNRGDLLLTTGDAPGALRDFDRVLELDPGFVDALVNRASLRLERGDLGGAQRDVDAGLLVAPDQPHLLALRGLLCREVGDLAGALRWLGAATEADPGLAAVWANLGSVHYDLGSAQECAECLRRSLEIEDDPQVRHNLALVQVGG